MVFGSLPWILFPPELNLSGLYSFPSLQPTFEEAKTIFTLAHLQADSWSTESGLDAL